MLNFVFIGVLILVVVCIAGFIVLKAESADVTPHNIYSGNESNLEDNEEDTE